MKRLFMRCGVAVSFCLTAAFATAADWPQKQIRVIVPYAAGSVPDTIARVIFDRVQKNTGQTMVIENKPGAAGMIGAELVAKSAPDGSTLLVAPSGPLVTNTLLYKKVAYDPLRDLAPVALVAETLSLLVASNAVTARNASELLRAMADPKNRIAYASPGIGTLSHLSMAYLVSKSGGDVPNVPFSGSPQIVSALMANDVQIAALPLSAVAPMIESGNIKAIAVVGPRRSTALPDIPTLEEQGVDFRLLGWFGVAASGRTPSELLEAIHAVLALALKDPALIKSFEAQGLEVADKGPKDFAAYMQRDLALWRPLVERNNIKLD